MDLSPCLFIALVPEFLAFSPVMLPSLSSGKATQTYALIWVPMKGCQNYGVFFGGILSIRGRIMIET